MKATIFDVQSFSVNDGPGIRTVVFFKGCPLTCRWCHNPESNLPRVQLVFKKTLCVSCLKCVDVCPNCVHTVALEDGTYRHKVNNDLCKGCGKCLSVCCYDALSLVGKDYTPDMLYEKLKGDFHYFSIPTGDKKETGGITFSGGEPLLAISFIEEMRKKMPDVHFAIETSGFASHDVIRRAADVIDLFLFDYKVTGNQLHRHLTGVGNKEILSNLEYLCSIDKPVVLRLPLIPGVNDLPEHFDAIAKIINEHPNIIRGEIMPYHVFGLSKIEELGMTADSSMPTEGADDEQVERWLQEIRSRGCDKIIRS